MMVAVPLLTVALPTEFPFSKKVTEPVGVPLPVVGAIVAVVFTGPTDPTVTVLGESDNVVVVEVPPPPVTVRVIADDVEPAKVVSPPYCAVMG